MSGILEAIWVKRVRRGPMDPVPRATLIAGRGIEGNANQGGRRQVTIIGRSAWDDVVAELDTDIDPSARRANLLIEGVDLRDSRERVLRIGACRVRVRGETRPCRLMDEALPGLQAALRPDWRGGVFGQVLDDGDIRVGDPVRWEE